jgi:hypothetical protein
MPPNRDLPEKPLWFRLMGTAEGLLSLVVAIGSWVYALRPVGPMVGMPVEAFLRDMTPLLPVVIGFALAVGGIRHGHRFARWAGWCAAVLLLPLIVLFLVMGARRSFLA